MYFIDITTDIHSTNSSDFWKGFILINVQIQAVKQTHVHNNVIQISLQNFYNTIYILCMIQNIWWPLKMITFYIFVFRVHFQIQIIKEKFTINEIALGSKKGAFEQRFTSLYYHFEIPHRELYSSWCILGWGNKIFTVQVSWLYWYPTPNFKAYSIYCIYISLVTVRTHKSQFLPCYAYVKLCIATLLSKPFLYLSVYWIWYYISPKRKNTILYMVKEWQKNCLLERMITSSRTD